MIGIDHIILRRTCPCMTNLSEATLDACSAYRRIEVVENRRTTPRTSSLNQIDDQTIPLDPSFCRYTRSIRVTSASVARRGMFIACLDLSRYRPISDHHIHNDNYYSKYSHDRTSVHSNTLMVENALLH